MEGVNDMKIELLILKTCLLSEVPRGGVFRFECWNMTAIAGDCIGGLRQVTNLYDGKVSTIDLHATVVPINGKFIQTE